MQQGDYSNVPYYPYPQYPPNPSPSPNPNPIPSDHSHSQTAYASAPPFSSGYVSSDYPIYPQTYPQNPDPTPNPNLTSFNSASQAPSFPPFESHGGYQTPRPPPPPAPPAQTYYSQFDQQQTAPNYAPVQIPNPNPTPSNPTYPSPYGQAPVSVPPIYDAPYENYSAKFDQPGSYFDDRHGRSDSGFDPYGKQRYDSVSRDDGVYAYRGSNKPEPYGARGTAPKSNSSALFDDYGRSISFGSAKDSQSSVGSGNIVRAVPKADSQQDSTGGVQKFRVKILAESGGQSTMDVLCQIGLDGIRMLDPSNSRTLRIYPLENITRCEKVDSSTLGVWSKSSVDLEPRRIRLQSNSYTTNTLLDTVTAATVQLKEMGGSSRPSESYKPNDQVPERKKGFVEWVNIIKPANEEKDHWIPDEAVSKCTGCGSDFGAFLRKHHCRNCGDIYCDKCTQGRTSLTLEENAPIVRVCDRCMAEVTQRLSNVKESANKPMGLQSHEDLAKKLHEELERNRKSSSSSASKGSRSDSSGRRMREVACPICTVHLQVQVPSSGSETIECGVCQSPFLVSAH